MQNEQNVPNELEELQAELDNLYNELDEHEEPDSERACMAMELLENDIRRVQNLIDNAQ